MVSEIKMLEAFRKVKSDVVKLQKQVIELNQTQKRLLESLENNASAKKTGAKRAKKIYVAPKDGKTFHLDNCPFAKNIKPKNKRSFSSKTKALNEGFKPCDCVN
jgi:methylphosphotriester-DNA--protein-cysteine methyltransferase